MRSSSFAHPARQRSPSALLRTRGRLADSGHPTDQPMATASRVAGVVAPVGTRSSSHDSLGDLVRREPVELQGARWRCPSTRTPSGAGRGSGRVSSPPGWRSSRRSRRTGSVERLSVNRNACSGGLAALRRTTGACGSSIHWPLHSHHLVCAVPSLCCCVLGVRCDCGRGSCPTRFDCRPRDKPRFRRLRAREWGLSISETVYRTDQTSPIVRAILSASGQVVCHSRPRVGRSSRRINTRCGNRIPAALGS